MNLTHCFHCGRLHKKYAGDGFCSVGCRAAGMTPLRELNEMNIDTYANPNETFLPFKQELPMKAIICVDFDGVIHSYTTGWHGADQIWDGPVPGAIEWLLKMLTIDDDKVQIAIRSSRSKEEAGINAMRGWLHDQFSEIHDYDYDAAWSLVNQIDWGTAKPSALVTIDDRALTFKGDWSEFTVERLLNFKPWNKK